MICKLKRILKGFTSIVAQRVFFDDTNNATCKSRVGFNGLPYSVTFPYKRRMDTCVRYNSAVQICIVYRVSYRRLAIKIDLSYVFAIGWCHSATKIINEKSNYCRIGRWLVFGHPVCSYTNGQLTELPQAIHDACAACSFSLPVYGVYAFWREYRPIH